MPTWGGILQELADSQRGGGSPQFDQVRRKYLVLLHQHTRRAVILYATKWTQPDPNIAPQLVSVIDEDVQALMEVINRVTERNLDLILHSPGGSADAAEGMVMYLRSKFSHIRVVVPHLAMSAATMIACAADEIVLGKHSFLGPIDPQLILATPVGQRLVPAENILEQFERAKAECEDPSELGAWLPMLNQYGPDLLVTCERAKALAEQLVRDWLRKWMFKGDPSAKAKANAIAEWLSDHSYFKSHGRHIPRGALQRKKLKILPLEQDQTFQELVLSIFHATAHTFNGTPAVKIVENHLGRAFIKHAQGPGVFRPVPGPQPRPQVAPGPLPQPSPTPPP